MGLPRATKEVNGNPVKKSGIQDYSVTKVTQFVAIFALDAISKQIELPDILGKQSKQIMSLVFSHLLDRVSIYKVPEWIERTEILNILKLKKITGKDLYESLYSLSEINLDSVGLHTEDILNAAKEAGKELINNGKISTEIQHRISGELVPKKSFTNKLNSLLS